MYLEKRWLFPTMLSVVLLAGICVVVALALRPVDTRTVQLASAAPVNPTVCAPAPPGPAQAAAPARPGRRDTQINTGGFGDIGMQFQNVDVNAPISNAHISNSGDGNNNNVNVGQDNMIFQDNTFNVSSGPAAASTPPDKTSSPPPSSTTPTTSSSSSSSSSSPPSGK